MAAKKDMQDQATALGIPFTNKTTVPQLKELIAAKQGTVQDNNSTVTSGSQQSLGKAEIMKRKLDAQPKVPIMIPLAPGESVGSTDTVILNGYRLNIQKGVYVHVPQQVAQVIMESQQQTQEAIQNYFAMNSDGVSEAMRKKSITN